MYLVIKIIKTIKQSLKMNLVTKSQLEALLPVVVSDSTFKIGDFTFLPMGMGTHLVLNLLDGVPCLREDRSLSIYVDRDISYGGSAIEAGWGPIRFENTVESFRSAIETALRLLATRSDADEEDL